MAEDLDALLQGTEGERPSDEFVARLRELVVAEATSMANNSIHTNSGPDDVATTPPGTTEIDSRQAHQTTQSTATRRWTQLAMAAAALAIITAGAIALRPDRGTGQLETITAPDHAAPTSTSPLATPLPTATSETTATPLAQWDTFLPPGVYQFDRLGTPMTITTTDPLWVDTYRNGLLVLTHTSSQFIDDRRLHITRPSALSDPTDPTKPLATYEDGWPPNDFAGWLDNLAPGIAATNEARVTVGGHDALRVDLEIDNIDCGSDTHCAYFATNWLINTKVLNVGSNYRIWMIEQDNQAPIFVIASTLGLGNQDEQEWLDAAEQIVSRMEFADIAPHPLSVTPSGTIESQLLGGVEVELKRPSIIEHTAFGFYQIPFNAESAAITALENPFDHQGNALQSAADLIDYMRNGAELTERDGVQVDGLDTQVFDTDGARAEWVQLRSSSQAERGLQMPDLGRVWIIEHPSRGLLVVFAAATDEAQQTYPIVLDEAAKLLETLMFIE